MLGAIREVFFIMGFVCSLELKGVEKCFLDFLCYLLKFDWVVRCGRFFVGSNGEDIGWS